MYRVSLAIAIIFFGSVVGGQDNASEKDLRTFQGAWKIVSMMRGAKEEVQGKVEDATAVISGNGIKLILGKENFNVVFKLDATKKPTTIDLGDAKEGGFPNKGIYELKGDMLTLCWGNDGEPRPTKLTSTKEGEERLLVLQRIKK